MLGNLLAIAWVTEDMVEMMREGPTVKFPVCVCYKHIIPNKVHTYIIFLCFGIDIFDVQSCFRDQYFGRSPCMCILATHIILMQVTYIYHVLVVGTVICYVQSDFRCCISIVGHVEL